MINELPTVPLIVAVLGVSDTRLGGGGDLECLGGLWLVLCPEIAEKNEQIMPKYFKVAA